MATSHIGRVDVHAGVQPPVPLGRDVGWVLAPIVRGLCIYHPAIAAWARRYARGRTWFAKQLENIEPCTLLQRSRGHVLALWRKALPITGFVITPHPPHRLGCPSSQSTDSRACPFPRELHLAGARRVCSWHGRASGWLDESREKEEWMPRTPNPGMMQPVTRPTPRPFRRSPAPMNSPQVSINEDLPPSIAHGLAPCLLAQALGQRLGDAAHDSRASGASLEQRETRLHDRLCYYSSGTLAAFIRGLGLCEHASGSFDSRTPPPLPLSSQ